MEKDHRLQADDWVELAENDPGPAIEMLKKVHRVQTAAELHPSLAFAEIIAPRNRTTIIF